MENVQTSCASCSSSTAGPVPFSCHGTYRLAFLNYMYFSRTEFANSIAIPHASVACVAWVVVRAGAGAAGRWRITGHWSRQVHTCTCRPHVRHSGPDPRRSTTYVFPVHVGDRQWPVVQCGSRQHESLTPLHQWVCARNDCPTVHWHRYRDVPAPWWLCAIAKPLSG